MSPQKKIIFKLVLTGGPCGGKTTGQARLCTFFENLGWRVYRVPETASVLLGGGIKFTDLDIQSAYMFQENLLKTMIQIENTFFKLAESSDKNCIIICDRGTMDATAFISEEQCQQLMTTNGWNTVEIRDNRYDLVVHMVSAAVGAVEFYTTMDHCCRSEDISAAVERDKKAAEAWIGHPYFDVVDNSTDFDTKIRRLIATVCAKLGIDTGDRLSNNSRKVKFLVGNMPPQITDFPPFRDFEVVHDYLVSPFPKSQSRLRRRGQNGNWTYTHTTRRKEMGNGQTIEVRTQVTSRDYYNMVNQRDRSHYTIYKTRRCFLWNNQYFQLDIYRDPCHRRCKGLVLLETYTTLSIEELYKRIPNFLDVKKEVTNDPNYSMYNLSLKDDRKFNKEFTHVISNFSNGVKYMESNGILEAEYINGTS